VYPVSGRVFCFDPSPESVTLAPGEERSRTIEIRRSGPSAPGEGFPPAILERSGRYFAYAQAGFTLADRSRVELESRKIELEIAP
jgi:hypothetical protein